VEEEEEDVFVFNDTIQGPRAPAVKPSMVEEERRRRRRRRIYSYSTILHRDPSACG
jgi:hypothetical protein